MGIKCLDLSSFGQSCVCAVLEANGKVNGIGEISHPSTSQILGPIWMRLQIYHYVPHGVDVQNLVKIDLAVAALRMRPDLTQCGQGRGLPACQVSS